MPNSQEANTSNSTESFDDFLENMMQASLVTFRASQQGLDRTHGLDGMLSVGIIDSNGNEIPNTVPSNSMPAVVSEGVNSNQGLTDHESGYYSDSSEEANNNNVDSDDDSLLGDLSNLDIGDSI